MADGLFNPLAVDIYDRLEQMGMQIPKPAMIVPVNETNAGTPGNDETRFAQQGHSHPRLTSTTTAVLDSNGQATIMFTRTFANQPGVVLTEVNAGASNQPLVLVAQSFIMTGPLFSGVNIKGYRSQPLPNQNQITVASLLTSVISGVNAIASSLTGYNVFGGTAAGAQVSVVAIARSDV